MPFCEIKGQSTVVKFLKNALINNKFHHSYLFIGSYGVGKTLTAKNFAKSINCILPKNGEACEECPSCLKIEKKQSPDVFFVESSSSSGVFGIEDVRNLQHLILLKPYESKKKVFIIEDASRMTIDAANAFLKTLEEPPKDSVIILIAHDKSKILSTIYSRCEVIQFMNLPMDIVKEIVLEKLNVEEKKADFISHFSVGSLGRVSRFKNTDDIIDFKNKIIDGFSSGNSSYEEDVKFGESKESLLELIEVISFWYRDILMAKLGLVELAVNKDRMDDLLKYSEIYSLNDLEKVLKSLEKAVTLMNLNANTKLSMSVLKMEIDDICTKSYK